MNRTYPPEAINGRLQHLRGSALGFRNITNYIARSLLETGGFRQYTGVLEFGREIDLVACRRQVPRLRDSVIDHLMNLGQLRGRARGIVAHEAMSERRLELDHV